MVSSMMYPPSLRLPSPKYPSSLYITTLGTEILANGLSGNKPHPTPNESRCSPVIRWFKKHAFLRSKDENPKEWVLLEKRGDWCVSRRRGQKQGNSKGMNAEALGWFTGQNSLKPGVKYVLKPGVFLFSFLQPLSPPLLPSLCPSLFFCM